MNSSDLRDYVEFTYSSKSELFIFNYSNFLSEFQDRELYLDQRFSKRMKMEK